MTFHRTTRRWAIALAGAALAATTAPIASAAPGAALSGPSTKYKPKDPGTVVANGVPQPPSVGVRFVQDALSNASRLAENAVAGRSYEVWQVTAAWKFRDDSGNVVYDDLVRYEYRVSAQDGSIYNPVMTDNHCIAAGTPPHDASVSGECYAHIGIPGGSEFSFVTYGEYEDRLLLLPYDNRVLQINVTVTPDGQALPDCSRQDDVPARWTNLGCEAYAERIA